jgi:23S rRNA (pseudouridine1915-N3)-methyltransferase
MQLLLVAVGTLRPALREVCDDYLGRFTRFMAIKERQVRQAGRAGHELLRREAEGRRVLEAIPDNSDVVLLDLDGAQWSSEELAAQLDAWRRKARDRTLIIGGAAGVALGVRQRAGTVWSLGPLTLPHELARVVVAEQLYRASTILRGEPYHRGAR